MSTGLSIMCACLPLQMSLNCCRSWIGVEGDERSNHWVLRLPTLKKVVKKPLEMSAQRKLSHQCPEIKSSYATTRSSPNAGKLFAPASYSRRKVVPPSSWVNSDSDLFKFSCISRSVQNTRNPDVRDGLEMELFRRRPGLVVRSLLVARLERLQL